MLILILVDNNDTTHWIIQPLALQCCYETGLIQHPSFNNYLMFDVMDITFSCVRVLRCRIFAPVFAQILTNKKN